MRRQEAANDRSTTAEQALTRTVLFLRTVSTDPHIRTAMESTGFAEADVDEGWRLLRAACSSEIAPRAPKRATKSQDAYDALEAFAKTMLPRAEAALGRLHPRARAFVFDGLPSGRVATVLRVATFVDRCEALAGKRRSSDDHAAHAALAKRGLTAAALAEAKANVAIAMTASPDVTHREARRDGAALERLHAWLKDWSDCARTVITRRDWLIRLGIGRRRPMKRRR
ncbi:MAG TPA: hypothetical protein VGH87_02115 [Polyangiaceae bacterium]|jgi:hypothetical protein